jgi:hypothetical protein
MLEAPVWHRRAAAADAARIEVVAVPTATMPTGEAVPGE